MTLTDGYVQTSFLNNSNPEYLGFIVDSRIT